MDSSSFAHSGGKTLFSSCGGCGVGFGDPHNNNYNSNIIRERNQGRKEIKQTEDLLASEMKRLTVQERSVAMDDLHCVGQELQETPQMIATSLAAFEKLIQKEKNPIYEMAAKQNRSYVDDPSFRLKFLRANLHNVPRSVRQMMNFLRYKATYFGDDKVARDITLDDLDEEDMKLMFSGLFHIQDGRDQTGRVVIYLFNTLLGKCKAETLIRVAYYIWFNIMIPLPEVQMKGLVGVYMDVAKPGEKIALPGFNFMLTILNFTISLPMRYSGMHLCVKSDKGNLALNNTILGIAMNSFPQYARVRSRLHCGSNLELQYQLKSHGLPIDTCPVDANGEIRGDEVLNAWFYKHHPSYKKTDGGNNNNCMVVSKARSVSHHGFDDIDIMSEAEEIDEMFAEHDDDVMINDIGEVYEGCELIAPNTNNDVIPGLLNMKETQPVSEESSQEEEEEERKKKIGEKKKPKEIIVNPTKKDVLLGRGRDIQNHEGNVQFRKFLVDYSDDYDRAPRSKRRKIATDLSVVLGNKGIRFLQQAGLNEWIESDQQEAEKKIAQLFRSFRKTK